MEFDNLHQILRSLYEQMMPLCGDMAGVAKGIAGLGALFYVAYRVWQSLARAEPIDVFPSLRLYSFSSWDEDLERRLEKNTLLFWILSEITIITL